jgi:hypothetical protein
VAEIAVGGPTTFDYLLADGPSKRLYVSHGTEVVVIDTEKNTMWSHCDTPERTQRSRRHSAERSRPTAVNKVSIIDLKTPRRCRKSRPAPIRCRHL